jgi:lipopolysaccharide transport system ATP-binding protein
MSSDAVAAPVIEARGVGKCYTLYDRPSDRLADLLVGRWHRRGRPFWALRGVDLRLGRGETVGIVGRNGAGKSTLLQLVCGTLAPSEGQLAVHGRVAALLELGAGFNPDFSGRENARLNAALMGLTAREIDDRLDGIIDFAELGAFIDQPVKHYSSGMFMRLAFSVATAVQPDVLVIDEALSVGDGAFARKSFDRIMALKEAGATVLFCSHSMYQVEVLCARALWVEGGRLRMDGPAGEVCAAYQASLNAALPAAASRPAAAQLAAPRGGGAIVRVTPRVNGRAVAGGEPRLRSGRDTLELEMAFVADPALPVPTLAIGLSDANGLTVSSALSRHDGVGLERDAEGRGCATLRFDALPLLKGDYVVTAFLLCENATHLYDQVSDCVRLRVVDDGPEQGMVRLPHRWQPQAAGALPGCPGRIGPEVVHVGGRVLLLRELARADAGALLALHRRVFGSDVDEAWFEWKYVAGRGFGAGLWEGETLVAFCGGVPRTLHDGDGHGEGGERRDGAVAGLQIGDVMVDPAWRGVLTRRGPFFHVSRALYAHALGPGRRFAWGFGFPSERHLRLAQRLQLLHDGGPMHELQWALPEAAGAAGGRPEVVELQPDDASWSATVDAAWGQMRASMPGRVFGDRSAQHVRWRYLERPGAACRLLLVGGRGAAGPAGIAVVSAPGGRVQWLDWIGPPSALADALAACLADAAGRGARELWAWASTAVAAAVDDALPAPARPRRSEVARIGVPVASELGAERLAALPWWWLGGDTDFL